MAAVSSVIETHLAQLRPCRSIGQYQEAPAAQLHDDFQPYLRDPPRREDVWDMPIDLPMLFLACTGIAIAVLIAVVAGTLAARSEKPLR